MWVKLRNLVFGNILNIETLKRNLIKFEIESFLLPVVPHKAVAEVSKIGNL